MLFCLISFLSRIIDMDASNMSIANNIMVSAALVTTRLPICRIVLGIYGIIHFLITKTVAIEESPNIKVVFMLTNPFR